MTGAMIGARIRISRTLSRVLRAAKEDIHALESLDGYILWSCWEPKRKSEGEKIEVKQ